MDNLLNSIRKPIIWIYVSVIYLWFLAIGKLFASIAPPYLIAKIADKDNSLSIIEIREALLTYSQEVSNKSGINSHYFLYSMMANIVVFIPILIIGLFILKKKTWARKALIVLLIFLVLMPIVLSGFSFELSLTILNIDTLVYAAIIYLFTRKSTKEYFIEKKHITTACT